MTVIVNVPVALKHKILKLHPHATVVVGGHDDTMENLLNTASYNLEPVTDKQTTCKLKIINAFVWIIAPNGRKHVLGGIRKKKKKKKTCRVPRERQTTTDIFWLQLKEQLSHAPLCVVSCFASVHNEHNYPSFSFSWRKSIIHITGRAGHSKALRIPTVLHFCTSSERSECFDRNLKSRCKNFSW